MVAFSRRSPMNRDSAGQHPRRCSYLKGPVIALLGIACIFPAAGHAQGGACQSNVVAVDSTSGTVSGELILGMAWGETFVASDTLLSSARVWRITSEAA